MLEPIDEKKNVIQGSFGKFQSFSLTLDSHRTQIIRKQDTLFSVEIYKAIRLVYRYPPITLRNVEVSLVWRVWTKKVFIFLLQKLGCDLILNSTAKEDKCRVCNGIGENCKTHKGVTTDVGDGELYFKNQNKHNITMRLLRKDIIFTGDNFYTLQAVLQSQKFSRTRTCYKANHLISTNYGELVDTLFRKQRRHAIKQNMKNVNNHQRRLSKL